MIPYGRQQIDDDDVAAVVDVLNSDWLTTGPKVSEFEAAVAAYVGCRHAVAVSNGTAALHVACLALGIGPEDTGVTVPLTFLASANAFVYCGARADFVDIDATSLTMSPAALEAYIDEHGTPKVVTVVDYAGIPADWPAIRALQEKHGFAVIEDAAHALGSFYEADGKRHACGGGSHADLGVFSFHPVKTITSGEGGVVTTNDDDLAQRLRLFSNHGTVRASEIADAPGPWYYEMQALGFNYRLSDIHAALGLSQLSKLERFKRERRAIVDRYTAAFATCAHVTVPQWAATDPCFHLFPIQLADAACRSDLFAQLREQGFGVQVHYIPVHLQPFYRQQFACQPGSCPVAESYYDRCLSLPLFPGLAESAVDEVIDIVLEAAL